MCGRDWIGADPLEVGGFGLVSVMLGAGFIAKSGGIQLELVFPILEAEAMEVEHHAEVRVEFCEFLSRHEALNDEGFDGVQNGIAEGVAVNLRAALEDLGELVHNVRGVGERRVGGVETLDGADAGLKAEAFGARFGREFDGALVGMLIAPAEDLLTVFS